MSIMFSMDFACFRAWNTCACIVRPAHGIRTKWLEFEKPDKNICRLHYEPLRSSAPNLSAVSQSAHTCIHIGRQGLDW